MAQQGVQTNVKDAKSETAEQVGAAGAQQPSQKDKPVVEKLQETTNNIKDYFAEKLDQASAATKTTFVSGNESKEELSRDSVQG